MGGVDPAVRHTAACQRARQQFGCDLVAQVAHLFAPQRMPLLLSNDLGAVLCFLTDDCGR